MSNFYAPQYDPKSLYTDGCTSQDCMNTLSAPSSLTQGQTFDRITAPLHGGRRNRNRKNRRTNRIRKMRGGFDAQAAYPSQFSEMLPQDMHASARIGALDTSFAALPQFIGKYGNQMGGARRRKTNRRLRGGMAPITMPSMLLTPEEEPAAMLNPQWYTENLVVPSFQGPANSYAQQAYENQIAYQNHNPGAMPVPPTPPPATGGARRKNSRKNHRKTNRKNRKNNRKSTRRSRTLKAW